MNQISSSVIENIIHRAAESQQHYTALYLAFILLYICDHYNLHNAALIAS